MLESRRLVPDLSEAEIDEIWGNTKRRNTATNSEVAVLFDLAEGLKKSGYKYNSQTAEEQRRTSFVIVDRSSVGQTLELLCSGKMINCLGTGCSMLGNYLENDRAFGIRLNGDEYRGGNLGLHPSSVLNSQDFVSNPELLVLLVGELSPESYFSGNIKTDSKNKEIIVESYCRYIDDNETEPMNRFKERNLSETEAFNLAVKSASAVSSLSSLEKRSKYSNDLPMIYFEFERSIGGNMGLNFENPYLTIDEKPLYKIGTINQNLIKKRVAQENLARVGSNQKAQRQIEQAIRTYDQNLALGKGAYFPMFTMLN